MRRWFWPDVMDRPGFIYIENLIIIFEGYDMLANWTQELFEQNLNTLFEVEVPGSGSQSLELITLTRLVSSPAAVAFSAIFRGPLERPFGQGMYPTSHAQMGQVELFLVPVGREADGMRYEAVFNRMVKS